MRANYIFINLFYILKMIILLKIYICTSIIRILIIQSPIMRSQDKNGLNLHILKCLHVHFEKCIFL